MISMKPLMPMAVKFTHSLNPSTTCPKQLTNRTNPSPSPSLKDLKPSLLNPTMHTLTMTPSMTSGVNPSPIQQKFTPIHPQPTRV